MATHVLDPKVKLRDSLLGLKLRDLRVSVVPGDYNKLLATIVSDDFEGMDEADRQQVVWDQVFRTLTEDEQSQIEFLFTEAPSELEPTADSDDEER